jgi:RNA polymerase sigma-B factor
MVRPPTADTEEDLVRRYLPLARSLAVRFASRGAEFDDLVQVANLALVKAIRRFDSEIGAFAPFATATISGELKRHLRDQCWMVRPPRRIQELQARIAVTVGEVVQRDGEEPGPATIANAVDATVDETVEALTARGCFTPASLDRPSPITGRPLGDSISEETSAFGEVEARVALRQICDGLDESDLQLIWLRYFDNRSQRQIATELNISQMQVSRRLRSLLDDLRERAGELEVA